MGRKLPRQVDNPKVEFSSASRFRKTTGGTRPRESCGRGLVVDWKPPIGDLVDLAQALKQVCVEHLLTVRAVESLDECVLMGFAGRI